MKFGRDDDDNNDDDDDDDASMVISASAYVADDDRDIWFILLKHFSWFTEGEIDTYICRGRKKEHVVFGFPRRVYM